MKEVKVKVGILLKLFKKHEEKLNLLYQNKIVLEREEKTTYTVLYSYYVYNYILKEEKI